MHQEIGFISFMMKKEMKFWGELERERGLPCSFVLCMSLYRRSGLCPSAEKNFVQQVGSNALRKLSHVFIAAVNIALEILQAEAV